MKNDKKPEPLSLLLLSVSVLVDINLIPADTVEI